MRRSTLTLVLAAAFGLAAQLLFYRESLGLNVPVATVLLLLLAWRSRRAGMPRADTWMPAFAVAFAGFIAIRTEVAVVAFDVLALLMLALATTVSLHGITVTRLPILRLIAAAWRTATGTLWRAAPLLRCGARHLPPMGPARRVMPYLAGVLLAVPFVALFIALFTSADPVFARWWDEFVDRGEWSERLGEAKDRAIIAVVAAWLAAGGLAHLDRGERGAAEHPRGLLSEAAGTSFLLALVAIFAAFVVIQIAYLFGGRDTMEAASISYSEYARRGFFELLVVAGLVAGILFVLDLLIRRRTVAYVASGLVLLTLTGVVLASALYRLGLYQSAYGWSELRLYALALFVAVAAALVLIAWALLVGRMASALQPIVFVGLGVALLVNAVGPSGFIARANVSRLLEPASAELQEGIEARQLDRWYLTRLGDGAVADLVAAGERLPELERFCLYQALDWQNSWRDLAVAPSWQSWNLDRERAREGHKRIREYVQDRYGTQDRFHTECLRLPPVPSRPGRPAGPPD